jgi:hypothetical protein
MDQETICASLTCMSAGGVLRADNNAIFLDFKNTVAKRTSTISGGKNS